MAELDLKQATTGTIAPEITVAPETTDTSLGQDERRWSWPNYSRWLGYAKGVPQVRAMLKTLADWKVGRGFKADISSQQEILDGIQGMGSENFDAIMWNLEFTAGFNGDAIAHQIREKKTLINLKPLPMDSMSMITNADGIIIGYEQWAKLPDGKIDKNKIAKTYKPHEIFHIVVDRIGDEIHGTGIMDSIHEDVDALQEAKADKRRVLHNSSIRVIEVDTEDTTTRNTLKTEYAEAIKNGTVLIIPKDTVGFPDVPAFVHLSDEHIKYREDIIYQQGGVPKVMMGGTSDFTEASSKTAYVTFEQVWGKGQRDRENDIWNQLAIRGKFNKPVSFVDDAKEQEAANNAQTGFQPNDTNIGGVTNGQQNNTATPVNP